jgi:hypothetical protein
MRLSTATSAMDTLSMPRLMAAARRALHRYPPDHGRCDGRYQAYYPPMPTARRKLLRAGDGVHMSMNGYLRISKALARSDPRGDRDGGARCRTARGCGA